MKHPPKIKLKQAIFDCVSQIMSQPQCSGRLNTFPSVSLFHRNGFNCHVLH